MPDLGQTSILGTGSNTNERRAYGLTMPEAGALVSASIYLPTHSYAMRLGIYAGTGFTSGSGALIRDLGPTDGSSGGWNTLNGSGESLSGNVYIVFGSDGGGSVFYRFSTSAGSAGDFVDRQFSSTGQDPTAAWPDPSGWSGSTSRWVSLYLTYTPATGGGGPILVGQPRILLRRSAIYRI